VSLRDRVHLSWTYWITKEPNSLPWRRESPPEPLQRLLSTRVPGRALDIGCGTGETTGFLAQNGYEVTGIDFLKRPLFLAKQRSCDLGVTAQFLQADVIKWEGNGPYDLIVDMGCLHHLDGPESEIYRSKISHWLSRGGDYFLVHFVKRDKFDWRPIGPRRRSRVEINRLFRPFLREFLYSEEEWRVPLPIGPTTRIGVFWFVREV